MTEQEKLWAQRFEQLQTAHDHLAVENARLRRILRRRRIQALTAGLIRPSVKGGERW